MTVKMWKQLVSIGLVLGCVGLCGCMPCPGSKGCPCTQMGDCNDNDGCSTDACENNVCTNDSIACTTVADCPVGCAVACTNGVCSDASGKVFAVFEDPDSDFSTTEVRDFNDEIVKFDPASKSIIWVADNTEYQAGSWEVNGNFLGTAQAFQVRFGTVGGQRRAYFTETGPETICDIRIEGGSLNIYPTSAHVPSN